MCKRPGRRNKFQCHLPQLCIFWIYSCTNPTTAQIVTERFIVALEWIWGKINKILLLYSTDACKVVACTRQDSSFKQLSVAHDKSHVLLQCSAVKWSGALAVKDTVFCRKFPMIIESMLFYKCTFWPGRRCCPVQVWRHCRGESMDRRIITFCLQSIFSMIYCELSHPTAHLSILLDGPPRCWSLFTSLTYCI